MSAALAPGFADPVFDGQSVFRAVLDALARPGRAVTLPAPIVPPPPLTAELAAVALALADPDAPLWLDPTLACAFEVAAYLRFHTGARIVAEPREAAFALAADPLAMPDPSAFALGTDAYPDRSTTLVLAVPSFEGGAPFTIGGPGILGTAEVRASGLPAGFADQLTSNRALFPRGVDWLLVAPGSVLGLPRSVRVVAGSA